jgi:hypothetical protein
MIWLEAERFQDLGGWTNDAQFIDQRGSPYLLAIGSDGPVKDAVTRVKASAAGRYRLWARTRDWVPQYSPGRFQIVFNGKPAGHVFGESKAKGWVWEDGGVHELPAGPLEVRLRDLTGHYGRCDAILLTDDLDYRPPGDRDALMSARVAFGGVSREIEAKGPYDTVVVGGGLAGAMAAIASTRTGAKTALIQDRPVLGGNTSTEILVEPQGDTTHEPLDPGESGIIEEFRGPADQYSERMLKLCKAEPELDLFLNTHATGVQTKGPGQIAAVEAMEVTTGRRRAFAGSIFIDCTGDGAIGVWAGAEHRHGREPRAMYEETRAPEKADGGTMGGTLRYATEIHSEPVSFTAPAWAHKSLNCSDFNRERHPQLRFGGWQWVIEYGGVLNTYDDAEAIRDELLRIIWGMWDHAKNHCPKLAGEAKNYKLVWVSHVVGKRESRRLVGDYVMTEHDISPSKLFEDRVSYGGWGVDLHPPKGFYDPGPPATFSHKVKFSVPFRSLYSRDIGNLLMAGRDISVSHAALGATRVMVTCGLQGQAAGTAAALCKIHNTTPRGLYQSHIAELQQQLLKDGCYLIDLPNSDPKDLALGAKITASSFSPPAPVSAQDGRKSHRLDPPNGSEIAAADKRPEHRPETMFAPENVVNGFARAIRGWPNSWRPEPGKPLPQWVELDFGREVSFNCVHVAFQTRELRANAFRLQAPRGDDWQTVAEVTGNLQRRGVIRFEPAKAARLRLVITEAKPDMGVCEIRVYNER